MTEIDLTERNQFSHESTTQKIAIETLRSLIEFCPYVQKLCVDAAQDWGLGEKPIHNLSQLIDAITLFSESLSVAKATLNASSLQSVNLLETELVSILRDMKESYEEKDTDYFTLLLMDQLPANLEQWRIHGLPQILGSHFQETKT